MQVSRKIMSAPLSRRRFLVGSAMAAGATLGASSFLDACNTSTTTSGGGAATTVTVMYNTGEFTTAYINAFHKLHPDIKINFLTFDATRLNAMFAANQPPDFIRSTGAADMPQWAARGVAQDLTTYFNNSSVLKVDNLQSVNDVYRWDGKTQGQGPRYGMAKDWSLDGMMWYNKKLFDQAGVPVPSATEPLTYDELLALGKQLTVRKNGRIQVYGLDAAYGNFMQGFMLQMVAQQGGQLYSNDLSEIDFSTPEARKAVQWYIDWAQAGVGPSPLNPDATGGYGEFTSDRTAMLAYGYWYGGDISTQSQTFSSQVALIPAPQMGPNRISSCMSGTGAWIPASSKNKDAAWKVMEYFMGGQPSIDRAKSGWGIPSLKSLVPDMPQALPFQQAAFQTLQSEMPYQKTLSCSPYISDSGFDAALAQVIEPAMRGKLTLDQCVQQLNQNFNKLMQQSKQLIG